MSRVSARQERRGVCLCMRINASSNPKISLLFLSSSLFFPRVRLPAKFLEYLYTEILGELRTSVTQQSRNRRLTFHASIISLEKRPRHLAGPKGVCADVAPFFLLRSLPVNALGSRSSGKDESGRSTSFACVYLAKFVYPARWT